MKTDRLILRFLSFAILIMLSYSIFRLPNTIFLLCLFSLYTILLLRKKLTRFILLWLCIALPLIIGSFMKIKAAAEYPAVSVFIQIFMWTILFAMLLHVFFNISNKSKRPGGK